MNDKKDYLIPDIVEGRCLDCRYKYEVFSFGDYGGSEWPMRCSRCNKVKWTGGTDPIFGQTIKDFEKKYGNLYKDYYNLNEKADIFINQFENSCEPCECGGKYKLAMSEICPHCGSKNVKVNWDKIIRKEQIPFEKIIHKIYKEKGKS